jgi:cytochrome c peroxidase
MKIASLSILTLTFAIVFGLVSCTIDEEKLSPSPVTLQLPAQSYDYIFTTPELGTLGRVLFYDTRLSVNNAISCGSCHKQTLAFSDNSQLSRGFENKTTFRNTLPIQNINNGFIMGGFGGFSELFWDGREKVLDEMVLKPILNHVEMGMNDMDALVNRIKDIPYYKDLFFKAFGSYDIDATKIAAALSGFTGSILSQNTRFDLYLQGKVMLNSQELKGRDLFFNTYNCNSCHQTQMMTAYQTGGGFVNIGLDLTYTDNGLGTITKNSSDNGKFKIPSLRNVTLTGPYMHDGRFKTLDQVLDHYSKGIQNHPNLDSRLRNSQNKALILNIPKQDKEAIIAFLNTLADYEMITADKFSNPFKLN